MEYTATEKAAVIATCRKWKHPMAVEKAFHLLNEGDTILDYGCGKHMTLMYKLGDMGYDAEGHDLSLFYWHGRKVLSSRYDVVIASNVLNVQPDNKRGIEVLEELEGLARHLIIFNYPNSPRKWKAPAWWVRHLASWVMRDWNLSHMYYGSGTLTVATRGTNLLRKGREK